MKLNTLSFLAVVFLLACKPVATVGPTTGDGTPPTITISPSNPEMEVADTLQFTATEPVIWSADSGTISSAGLYTAPTASGTYRVSATSTTTSGKISSTPVKVRKTTVTISPNPATVAAGNTLLFTATVSGPSNTAVTWSIQETTGCGSINGMGLYSAPPTGGVTCHVVATSVANTNKKSTVAVSVTIPSGITLTISPSTVEVSQCEPVQFGYLIYGATNTAVTWSLLEGTAAGTITSGGLYTAPRTAASYPATFHVVATSVQDPSKSVMANITLYQVVATLTWSILEVGGGSISTTGFYTAPTTSGTYTVQATAIPSSGSVQGVTVSPRTVTLPPGGTQSFSANIQTYCGTGVVNMQLTKTIAGVLQMQNQSMTIKQNG